MSFKMFPDVFFHSIQKGNPESFQFFLRNRFQSILVNGRLYPQQKWRDVCMCVYVCVFMCEGNGWNAHRSQEKHQAWRDLRLTSIVLISAFPSLEL